MAHYRGRLGARGVLTTGGTMREVLDVLYIFIGVLILRASVSGGRRRAASRDHFPLGFESYHDQGKTL
jgi:hypothetical protein